MRISVQATFKELAREIARLPQGDQARIISATMNKAAAKGFTTAKREVSGILKMPQARFVKGGQGRRMFRLKANRYRLDTSIVAVGRPFNLASFGAIQDAKGVSASVMGRTRRVPGAFRLPVKGRPVMKRKGKPRLPLDQIWGAGAADALRTRQVQKAVTRRFGNELSVEYRRAVDHFFRTAQRRLDRQRSRERSRFRDAVFGSLR